MNLNLQPSTPNTNWKIPARFTPVVFAFFMAAIMALLMCAVIVGVQNGITDDYLIRVFKAYRLAMPVAFLCVMLVRPLVMKLVGTLVAKT